MMAMTKTAVTWLARNLGLWPFSLVRLAWGGCLLALLLLKLGQWLHLFSH
jgi:hypothetical protein